MNAASNREKKTFLRISYLKLNSRDTCTITVIQLVLQFPPPLTFRVVTKPSRHSLLNSIHSSLVVKPRIFLPLLHRCWHNQ